MGMHKNIDFQVILYLLTLSYFPIFLPSFIVNISHTTMHSSRLFTVASFSGQEDWMRNPSELITTSPTVVTEVLQNNVRSSLPSDSLLPSCFQLGENETVLRNQTWVFCLEVQTVLMTRGYQAGPKTNAWGFLFVIQIT